jgi:predicted nucleic acid-binding protein
VNRLADTSAWVEFLRGTGSSTNVALREGVRDELVVTTDPVIMEVLAGARTPAEEEQLAALIATARRIACERADYVEAARIHRACRSHGEQVRSMVDCLIAAVAIRSGIPLLHADRDFETIARHSELTLA